MATMRASAITLRATARFVGGDQRVLVVDLDPQANATSGLGQGKDSQSSMFEVLLEGMAIESVVRSTGFMNLDLAPAATSMAGAEVELVAQLARESRLQEALHRLEGMYDVIIVD